MRRIPAREIKIRLYPDDDDDLLEWIEANTDRAGNTTRLIKSTLRKIITGGASPLPQATSEEILAAIRAIQVSIDTIANSGLHMTPPSPQIDTSEAESNLDSLLERL